MHTKTRIIATAGLLAALAFAAPASAHEGHGSCAAGTEVYVVPMAQSGMAGEVVSAAAREGLVDEGTAASHAQYCEPQ